MHLSDNNQGNNEAIEKGVPDCASCGRVCTGKHRMRTDAHW